MDAARAPQGVRVEALRAGREAVTVRNLYGCLREAQLEREQFEARTVGEEFAATREIRRRRGLARGSAR